MKLTLLSRAMQCGIACLSMIFNHYKRDYFNLVKNQLELGG